MSDGSEFQVCGAATENAVRANSVRVLAADSIGATHCLVKVIPKMHMKTLRNSCYMQELH